VIAEVQRSEAKRERWMRELPETLVEDQAELWLEQRQRLEIDRGQPESAHQLLTAQRRKVVLLGEPGSGKTTLLRYFAVKVAQGESADIGLSQNENWFPILIYLRDWAKESERSLIEQLEHFATNTLHIELPKGFYQY
jgi:predicted NACHT family NTPase